ncbi:MAG TPA: hypothetical protein DCE18_20915 [Syntrophobacteraceae bacterium]|nr:hypothetical protein [Syntrophobacteraceae bacterium]
MVPLPGPVPVPAPRPRPKPRPPRPPIPVPPFVVPPPGPAYVPPPRPAYHGYSLRSVQRALYDLGYPVPVNGVWGSSTHRALRDFQFNNGLEPTGRVDRSTLDMLGL